MNGFYSHPFKREVVLLGSPPSIQLTKEAYWKQVYFAQFSGTDELGWMGTVEEKKNIYLIKDVFLLRQEVNSVSFKIDPRDLSAFATKMLSTPGGREIVNSLRFLGHIEPGNEISFGSSHDDKIMESYSKNNKFFIQAIASRSGNIQFSIYDFAKGLIFRDVEWQVLEEEDEALKRAIEKEVQRKVRIKKPMPMRRRGNVYVVGEDTLAKYPEFFSIEGGY